MSHSYQTQGYTLNNAGRRLVVDPITRIEGHMRCEVNIDEQNIITNAVSCGTMFRGLEIILQGRDRATHGHLSNEFAGCAPVYMPLPLSTPLKMPLALRCPTMPTSFAILCWPRCGATTIWCTFTS